MATIELMNGDGNIIQRIENINAIKKGEFKSRIDIVKVIINGYLEYIDNDAFCRCTNLQSINLPESVTSIGNYAFFNCKDLQSINIPEGVTSINKYAFHGCKNLQSIKIPESVTSIGKDAFHGCKNLQSINIPEGVTSIGNYAFFNCKGLQSIKIPGSVTSIGKYAFCGCTNLQSINIPKGVTSIGNYAFHACTGLQSINIPEGVTSIGNCAFKHCTALKSIIIPKSVTSIGNYTFNQCKSLTHIKIITTNQAEFERIKNLLPKKLQDKAIPVDLKKISEIKNKALGKLLYHPLATSLGTANLGDAKDQPVGKLPPKMIASINQFIIKDTLVYSKMKQALEEVRLWCKLTPNTYHDIIPDLF